MASPLNRHFGTPALPLAIAMLGSGGAAADAAQPVAASDPSFPFPQHISHAPGTLRPSQRTQTQQDDDVRALHDAWKSYYLIDAGEEPDQHPRYRISIRWRSRIDRRADLSSADVGRLGRSRRIGL